MYTCIHRLVNSNAPVYRVYHQTCLVKRTVFSGKKRQWLQRRGLKKANDDVVERWNGRRDMKFGNDIDRNKQIPCRLSMPVQIMIASFTLELSCREARGSVSTIKQPGTVLCGPYSALLWLLWSDNHTKISNVSSYPVPICINKILTDPPTAEHITFRVNIVVTNPLTRQRISFSIQVAGFTVNFSPT